MIFFFCSAWECVATLDFNMIHLVVRYLYLAVSLPRGHGCLGEGASTCTYNNTIGWQVVAHALGGCVGVGYLVVLLGKSFIVLAVLFIIFCGSFF